MKAERPSRTAHFVALGRAMADAGLSHVTDFSDPTARVFLTDKGARSLASTVKAVNDGKTGVRIQMAHAMANMIALRTAAIDKAVRESITAGARQVVILGAGYDGRAWRMPELAGIKVFEVDHPATQGEKRARVPELPPPKSILSFVTLDFERESLAAVLDRAGHDRAVPTCWVWEGVVMYLTQDAMHRTLAAIAGRSATRSTLIVNYHVAHRKWFARLMFRLIGEPQISAWSPEEMSDALKSAGFAVRDDTGMRDWNERFARGRARVDRGWYMRVAVAQR